MKATDTSANTAHVQADEAAVAEHLLTGKPLDPEVYRRIRARAEQITAQLRQRYGDMNLAVDLIRDIRDE
ncbi:MAG: hypothetical protein ACYC3I_01040 [Gemmataceae bacterium]